MIYRNPKPHALSFVIDGERYEIPAGGECNISPKHAYIVAARGLPLVEGSAGGKIAEPTLEPVKRMRLVPGVQTGEEPGYVDEYTEDEAPAVTEAVDRLKAQGAVPPKGKRR